VFVGSCNIRTLVMYHVCSWAHVISDVFVIDRVIARDMFVIDVDHLIARLCYHVCSWALVISDVFVIDHVIAQDMFVIGVDHVIVSGH